MFFNNKFNTFFGLNLTLVYTFPMCMTWRFHFPLRNYDFKVLQTKKYYLCIDYFNIQTHDKQHDHYKIVKNSHGTTSLYSHCDSVPTMTAGESSDLSALHSVASEVTSPGNADIWAWLKVPMWRFDE